MATLDNYFTMFKFFLIATLVLVMGMVWTVLSTNEQLNTDLWSHTTQGMTIKNKADNFYNNLDLVVVMVWVGMHLGLLILAFFLREYPAVIVAAVLLTILLPLMAAPLANAWIELSEDSEFTTYSAKLPLTTWIFKHLPQMEVISSIITIIVLIGLSRREGYV